MYFEGFKNLILEWQHGKLVEKKSVIKDIWPSLTPCVNLDKLYKLSRHQLSIFNVGDIN